MAQLNEYLQQCQRFIRDSGQKLIDVQDLIVYVNKARRDLAGQTQCIRDFALPISNGIDNIQVKTGGTGYLATDTLTIGAPDSPSGAAPWPGGRQATAGFTLGAGGSVATVNLIDGGDGYFQPTAKMTSATGSGATFICNVAGISQTVTNQEVYQFSAFANPKPGYGPIIAVRSVAIIYANYRYVILKYSWTTYQAMIRQYPRQYYYVPTMCAQLGQGASGSLFLYPIASQPYQMEWDCTFLPADLNSNLDAEAIPLPWTDAVPMLAAAYAFMELQNLNAANYYIQLYEKFLNRFSVAARPSQIVNPYGRY